MLWVLLHLRGRQQPEARMAQNSPKEQDATSRLVEVGSPSPGEVQVLLAQWWSVAKPSSFQDPLSSPYSHPGKRCTSVAGHTAMHLRPLMPHPRFHKVQTPKQLLPL